MRPVWSIIILTIFASIAEGVVIFLTTAEITATLGFASPLPADSRLITAIVALSFLLAALLASFFNLANKSRGIKAIMRWKTSWISRKVILFPIFSAMIFFYTVMLYFEIGSTLRGAIIFAASLTGLMLVISSAMIYYSIKFVKEWATLYTILNFIAVGLAIGSFTFIAILEFTNLSLIEHMAIIDFGLALIFIALLIKTGSLIRNDSIYSSITSKSALQFESDKIELIDNGAAYPHYNTVEYFHISGKRKIPIGRIAMIVLTFLLPIIGLLIKYYFKAQFAIEPSLIFSILLLMIIGGLIERWLFFVDSNHVQNIFYGNYQVKNKINPILTAGRDYRKMVINSK
ncbi:MAG: dimethyl sulfoxide reductase anchor subunit family protein [Nitrospinota bacterium]